MVIYEESEQVLNWQKSSLAQIYPAADRNKLLPLLVNDLLGLGVTRRIIVWLEA